MSMTSAGHTLLANLPHLFQNTEQGILLLNAYDTHWGCIHPDHCRTFLCEHFVYVKASDIVGAQEWQWTQLAQALKVWDEQFAFWMEKNAHQTTAVEGQIPAMAQQAVKRSGRCTVVVVQAELLYADNAGAEWERFALLAQQALIFALIGATECLSHIPLNKAIYVTRCNLINDYLSFAELSVLFTATGTLANPEIMNAIYEITQGWVFAALLLKTSLQYGQPLTENDLDTAVTLAFNKLDATLFATESRARKLAILLSQFDEFTYRMLVEVSPFPESVVKGCLDQLPGLQYKNYGRCVVLHPFMRQYLETRLHEVQKKMRDTCLRRAVLWYSTRHEYMNALRYSVIVKDYENMRIILRSMNLHRCYADSKAICSLLSEIPRSDLRKHPMIWMYKVVSFYVADENLQGREEKKSLEAYLAKNQKTAEQILAIGEIHTLNAFMQWGFPSYIDELKKASRYIDTSEIWDGRYADFVGQGTTLYYSENTGMTLFEAMQVQVDAEPYICKLFNNWGRGIGHLGLAEYYYIVGEEQQALENANQAIQDAMAHQQWDVASLAYNTLLSQHIKSGRFDEGLYASRNMHQFSALKKSPATRLADLADFTVYCVVGQYYLAADWIKDERPSPEMMQESDPGRSLYARCVYTAIKGDTIKALTLIDSVLGKAGIRNQWYIVSKLQALKLMVLVSLDMITPACQLLNLLYHMLEKHGCRIFLVEFGKLLNAFERLAQNAKAAGIKIAPLPWIRQLIEEGRKFEENKKRFAAAYFNKLQAGRDAKFSPSEYIVLQMKCMGFERKDIAQCLNVNSKYISALTNKICAKLKVKNTEEAVLAGRAMGIQNDDIMIT